MTARTGRLAPALGLSVAAVLLAAVGACAMSFADASSTPSTTALAVLSSTSPASSTPAARVVPEKSAAVTAHSKAPSSAVAKQPTIPHTDADDSAEDARAVFRAINQARIAQHLPPLTWSPRLQLSARLHNQAMAADNTLAHQVGTEGTLGQRENQAGIRWAFAAENIGWTTTRSVDGALGIQSSMLAESAPADAHRRNILSRDARSVGIAVLVDTEHGRLWLTEDFADVG